MKKALIFTSLILVLGIFVSCSEREADIEKEILKLNPELIDLILVIDHSSSMFKTTDSDAIRVEAAEYLAKSFGYYCSEDYDHRMGIVNFGSTIPDSLCIGLTNGLYKEANRKKILEKIKAVDLIDTDIPGAFKKAADLFGPKSIENRKRALILLTDGRPDPDGKSGNDPDKQAKLFEQLTNMSKNELENIEIFVIVIDEKNRFWPEDKSKWEKIAPGKCFKVDGVKNHEIERTFKEILNRHLLVDVETVFKKIAANPDGSALKYDFELKPYLQQVQFTILPESEDVKVNIYQPGKDEPIEFGHKSEKINYSGSELFRVCIIDKPMQGKWLYEIENGKAEIWRDDKPVTIEIIKPDSPYPAGKPLEIQLLFANKAMLKAMKKEYPLYFEMELDNKTVLLDSLLFVKETKLDQFSNLDVGTYDFTVKYSLAESKELLYEKTIPLEIAEIPYIRPVEETVVGKVKFEIVRSGKVEGVDIFEDDPKSLLGLKIYNTSDTGYIPIKTIKDGNFILNLRKSLGFDFGYYHLKTILHGTLQDEVKINQADDHIINYYPPIWWHLRYSILILIVLLLLGLPKYKKESRKYALLVQKDEGDKMERPTKWKFMRIYFLLWVLIEIGFLVNYFFNRYI